MSPFLLWLEPTRKGALPSSSIFLSSAGFVVSTYVLGTLDPLKRRTAYERMIRALAKRVESIPVEELSVKHSELSLKMLPSSPSPSQLSSHSLLGTSSLRGPHKGTQYLCGVDPSPPSCPQGIVNLTSFNEILKDQMLLYGELLQEDKLKLIAQAVYGGEHMLKNTGAAWSYFADEWDAVDSLTDEPLAERISPEGDLYRINIRSSKELGIPPKALFEAALRSAAGISADLPRRIERILPQSRSIGIEPGSVPITPSRHSESYRARVKPSYRLIRPQELNSLLGHPV